MRILITGGTGLIGSALAEKLHAAGHDIIIFSRKPSKVDSLYKATDNLQSISSDETIDAMINLSGEPIIDRLWSEKRKQALLASRVGVTEQLYELAKRLKHKPKVLISGSAIGYYGNQADKEMTEDQQLELHDDFAHQLCAKWEHSALQFSSLGVRVCIARLGVVVAAKGGMMDGMKLPFKLGLGASIASGKQWMSWVYLEDVVNAIVYLLQNTQSKGVYNLTAPNPVTNKQFSQALAKYYRRPLWFKAPGFLIKLALGGRSQLLLEGQRVIPKNLQKEGFQFDYPHLEKAFETMI